MTDAALVTGASSGIGLAVARMLVKDGWEVYGIGRDFERADISDAGFHPVKLDLMDIKSLLKFLDALDKRNLKAVINNAGMAYYGLHEELTPEQIAEIIQINLEVPEIIAARLIRTLRQNHGWLINIASVTAVENAAHAAAYGSSKAGLRQFSRALFTENRKYGVKVTCILPDITESGLYRHADFEPTGIREETLMPEDTADAVRYILHLPAGVVIPEVTIRPQKNKIMKKTLVSSK